LCEWSVCCVDTTSQPIPAYCSARQNSLSRRSVCVCVCVCAAGDKLIHTAYKFHVGSPVVSSLPCRCCLCCEEILVHCGLLVVRIIRRVHTAYRLHRACSLHTASRLHTQGLHATHSLQATHRGCRLHSACTLHTVSRLHTRPACYTRPAGYTQPPGYTQPVGCKKPLSVFSSCTTISAVINRHGVVLYRHNRHGVVLYRHNRHGVVLYRHYCQECRSFTPAGPCHESL